MGHLSNSIESDLLSWTGYVYGGLAHSAHIQYDDEFEKRGEQSVRRGIKRAGLRPEDLQGRRVMDVGSGFYALGFHRLGAIVEHRDVSTSTIASLNAYAKKRGYSNLTSTRTDLGATPLPSEHFDVIYLSGVFQHLAEPVASLVNLARALKPGGTLYLDIYRSGRWRWFVVDTLRKIADRTLLHDVLARFSETCALAELKSFRLRQTEMLVDDLFVDHVNLFHPDDIITAARSLGLESQQAVSSMDLVDPAARVDHSLFFAHVFNTMVFRKSGAPTGDATTLPAGGRCQLRELESVDGAGDVARLTAQFVLAHRAGTFSREQVVSHLANLYRMAHPCLPGDPYMVTGQQEPSTATSVEGKPEDLQRRHQLWSAFLSNALRVPNPLAPISLDSSGYELVRFKPSSG